MDMHTLLYLKRITNKDLLYSTRNSAQSYVAAWMGGEFGGEWIHVYVRLNPLAVHLKCSQLALVLPGYSVAVCSAVSDSLGTPGLQPTRLPRPWDFSGKNTGGLPSPSPRKLPDPGMKPTCLVSPELADRFFPTVLPGKPPITGYVKVKIAQLCLTLRDPTDDTVHGILQARILEWVAVLFSNTKQKVKRKSSCSKDTCCLADRSERLVGVAFRGRTLFCDRKA